MDERKIVKKSDGYHVFSEDGKKHLGGPYKTHQEALDRLKQVEYFKHKGEKSLIFSPEYRVLPLSEAELRVKRGENGAKTISGYAAKFGKMSQNLGGFQEKIHEKAFEKALKKSDVRALRNHDPDKILGREKSGTLKLEVDDVGLRYDIAVPETVVGRDTVTDIERGDLDGSSFSFVTDEDGDEWDHSTNPPTRTLTNIRDLYDVGPVTYPAYLDTEAAVRSLERSRSLVVPEVIPVRPLRPRILKLRLSQHAKG